MNFIMVKLMKVLRSLLAAAALGITSNAEADYLFTWHYILPQFQKFQGSFELTDAEMQPGATFNSDLFRNSVEISSLDGVYFNAKDPNWSDVGGHFDPQQSDPPFVMYINTHDDSHTISLSAVAAGTPDPSGANPLMGSISEYFPDGSTVTEHGWWSFQQIPEPSCSAFLFLAGVVWIAMRTRK
jgi:hypothetical protein